MAALPFSAVPEQAASGAGDFHLCWARADPEQRLGFRGGRFTCANRLLSFCVAVLATALFFGAVLGVRMRWAGLQPVCDMFLERGVAPYATMVFFFWALAMLYFKNAKLGVQRRALRIAAVPQQPDFVLNRETARAVLERMRGLVDDTRHFLLLNRIERGLSNLGNIGQIGDVSTILRNQSDSDEEQVASSYGLIHSFLWVIPVLGFIGTVIGLRSAIGALGVTLRSGGDLTAIREGLQAVTAGLATKFETTLVALVCAVIIQVLLSFLQAREGEFLDECKDYCDAHVVSKLKLL